MISGCSLVIISFVASLSPALAFMDNWSMVLPPFNQDISILFLLEKGSWGKSWGFWGENFEDFGKVIEFKIMLDFEH